MLWRFHDDDLIQKFEDIFGLSSEPLDGIAAAPFFRDYEMAESTCLMRKPDNGNRSK